jgi:transposase-like protein
MTCPACGSPYAVEMGELGNRIHYRCRDCGMDYSMTINKRYPRMERLED